MQTLHIKLFQDFFSAAERHPPPGELSPLRGARCLCGRVFPAEQILVPVCQAEGPGLKTKSQRQDRHPSPGEQVGRHPKQKSVQQRSA